MVEEKAIKGRFSTKKGSPSAKGSIKYAVHRKDNEGEVQYRNVFTKNSESVDKEDAYKMMDEDKQKYTYTIIINPGEKDSRGVDMQQLTRDVMQKLEEEGVKTKWVAVAHEDQTEFPHVHVIAKSATKIETPNFQEMRKEHYRSFTRQSELSKDGLEQIKRLEKEVVKSDRNQLHEPRTEAHRQEQSLRIEREQGR